jgi:hypothetical protein
MARSTLAAGGALTIALAGPAAAQAVPTIAPLKPCYVTADTAAGHQREGVEIVGAGFTPNATVDLSIDGEPASGEDGLKADDSGQLRTEPVPAPFVERGRRAFTLTLTERDNPANTVSAGAESTALGVAVKPRDARTSQKVRFKGSGFTQDAAIYAHYVYKGKVRKTVRLARKPRACGGFKVRRRQIPVRRPGLGVWTIQFDQSKRFVDPEVTPINYVRLGIRVRRVPR